MRPGRSPSPRREPVRQGLPWSLPAAAGAGRAAGAAAQRPWNQLLQARTEILGTGRRSAPFRPEWIGFRPQGAQLREPTCDPGPRLAEK